VDREEPRKLITPHFQYRPHDPYSSVGKTKVLSTLGGGGKIMGNGSLFSDVMVSVRGRLTMRSERTSQSPTNTMVEGGWGLWSVHEMDVDKVEWTIDVKEWKQFEKNKLKPLKKKLELLEKDDVKNEDGIKLVNVKIRNLLEKRFGVTAQFLKPYKDTTNFNEAQSHGYIDDKNFGLSNNYHRYYGSKTMDITKTQKKTLSLKIMTDYTSRSLINTGLKYWDVLTILAKRALKKKLLDIWLKKPELYNQEMFNHAGFLVDCDLIVKKWVISNDGARGRLAPLLSICFNLANKNKKGKSDNGNPFVSKLLRNLNVNPKPHIKHLIDVLFKVYVKCGLLSIKGDKMGCKWSTYYLGNELTPSMDPLDRSKVIKWILKYQNSIDDTTLSKALTVLSLWPLRKHQLNHLRQKITRYNNLPGAIMMEVNSGRFTPEIKTLAEQQKSWLFKVRVLLKIIKFVKIYKCRLLETCIDEEPCTYYTDCDTDVISSVRWKSLLWLSKLYVLDLLKNKKPDGLLLPDGIILVDMFWSMAKQKKESLYSKDVWSGGTPFPYVKEILPYFKESRWSLQRSSAISLLKQSSLSDGATLKHLLLLFPKLSHKAKFAVLEATLNGTPELYHWLTKKNHIAFFTTTVNDWVKQKTCDYEEIQDSLKEIIKRRDKIVKK
jgi:hypothetical protein